MPSTFSFSFNSPATIIQAICPLPPSNAKHNTKNITTRSRNSWNAPSRNQNVDKTDTVFPALDILCVFSQVTQPALVSVLAPLPINAHVKLITSNFTVVSAVRENQTVDISPHDITHSSQLADQFAALTLSLSVSLLIHPNPHTSSKRQRSNWCSFCSQLNTVSLVPSAERERFSFPCTLPPHYALPHTSCYYLIAFQSGTASGRQGGDVLEVKATFKRLHCHTFLLCIICRA
ncbi:hypothetical protein BLNAU_4527 [Blattamonas nauphoetae]|uniref:Uncharacterized protein n=1 Tax=Blattamonas nauphoetae TaxID=2049346 RepID=A0ABQ9YA89_9EUKA|nr:hypothetical protein BLNAU_4527 [Blattamonas nauphoetae]